MEIFFKNLREWEEWGRAEREADRISSPPRWAGGRAQSPDPEIRTGAETMSRMLNQLCHPGATGERDFFFIKIIFVRERQRCRQRKKQAFCGKLDTGLDPRTWDHTRAKGSTTEPPRCPREILNREKLHLMQLFPLLLLKTLKGRVRPAAIIFRPCGKSIHGGLHSLGLIYIYIFRFDI